MSDFERALSRTGKRLRQSSRDVYASMWAGLEGRLAAEGATPAACSVEQLHRAIQGAGDFATQQKLLSLANWVYASLKGDGFPAHNPCKSLQPYYRGRYRPTRAALGSDAVSAMVQSASSLASGWKAKRLAAMVALLGASGARTQELLALRVTDLTLPPATTEPSVTLGKGLTRRTLPLPVATQQALAEWLRVHPAKTSAGPGAWLFVADASGKAMDASTVWRQLKRVTLAVAPDVPTGQFGTGVFRTTLAHRLKETGSNSADISAALGHLQSESTEELLERVKLVRPRTKQRKPGSAS